MGPSDLLVEFPRVMEGQFRSARDEEQAGLRPYLSSITKGRVIRFEHDISSGRPVLTRYAFRDSRWERAGPFAQQKIEQIHEYTKLGNIVMLYIYERRPKQRPSRPAAVRFGAEALRPGAPCPPVARFRPRGVARTAMSVPWCRAQPGAWSP